MGTSNAAETDQTRDELLGRMSRLLPGQLEELLLRANVASQYLPPQAASPMERIVAAIRFAELNGQLAQLTRVLDGMPGQPDTEPRGVAAIRRPVVQALAALLVVGGAAALFGALRSHRVSLLVVPDAEAAAMIPPQLSRFTIAAGGRSVPLPREGVLLGPPRGLPAPLRAAYRALVVDAEPVALDIEYSDDIAAAMEVRFDGKRCRAVPPAASEDTLWLIRFDDCK